MAIDEELNVFVRDALSRGTSRSTVADVLERAGWEAHQVKGALAGFAEVDFPIPVPRPRAYLSPREAFLYLVLFSTLYVAAFNLGALIFELIDRAFPDAAAPDHLTWSTLRIRWAVASLIVSFPVFLFVSRLTRRDVRRDPRKRASRVRRWLTYLTMFIAAGVLIGDVTSLVYHLLGGELTIRFVLKAATVFGIAGAGFGYYLKDLRADEKEGMS
ncbi:MAG TPA: DUF5671 domain-containing protein [Vicinamibacterales bacterium]|nr:DUF5671 domain-containing protein [Vicinamibacterales bacterium]